MCVTTVRMVTFLFRVLSGILWLSFEICLLIFIILKSNLSGDFGHTETASGAKKRVVLRREFFQSNFKVE